MWRLPDERRRAGPDAATGPAPVALLAEGDTPRLRSQRHMLKFLGSAIGIIFLIGLVVVIGLLALIF